MSKHTISTVALALVTTLTGACSFIARDTDTYRDDTSRMLDTRSGELQACYDQELARNPAMTGKLTISFTVEKKTGKVTALAWEKDRSTVSETLATCVTTALAGLELKDPDQRDGQATFVYSFTAGG